MKILHGILLLGFSSHCFGDTTTFESNWADRTIRCEGKLEPKPILVTALPELPDFEGWEVLADVNFEPEMAKIVLKTDKVTALFVSRAPNVGPEPELALGSELTDIDTPESQAYLAWFQSLFACLNRSSRMYQLPSKTYLEFPVSAHCSDGWDSPDRIHFSVYDVDGELYIEFGWPTPSSAESRLIRVTDSQLVKMQKSTC